MKKKANSRGTLRSKERHAGGFSVYSFASQTSHCSSSVIPLYSTFKEQRFLISSKLNSPFFMGNVFCVEFKNSLLSFKSENFHLFCFPKSFLFFIEVYDPP